MSRLLPFAVAALLSVAVALYEDQAGVMDWTRENVGAAQLASLRAKGRAVLATDAGVVAALNVKTGAVTWRRVFGAGVCAVIAIVVWLTCGCARCRDSPAVDSRVAGCVACQNATSSRWRLAPQAWSPQRRQGILCMHRTRSHVRVADGCRVLVSAAPVRNCRCGRCLAASWLV
jgi:hypothetical protein